jgi:DNA-binding response OmpR family regulator
MQGHAVPDLQDMSTHARIALVEDDADLLHSTQEYLNLAGFSVWGVGSAEAFFRRFAADPVDLVVLDIGLPGEDGLSVTQLLKQNPQVAVIILSARDSLDDRLAGMNAGADRYLVKPVNLAELAANIDAVIKRMQLPLARASLDLPRQVSGNSGPQWKLDIQTWLLTAPNGQQLKLTAREFALLHRLIKVHGQAIPKKDLTDEIFGQRISNASDRLNVLITRLRKKAADALSDPLPIKTAHQIGYAFTAPAILL